MDATHITIASVDRAVLYPNDEALLDATRTLARVAGPDLLLFCVVDDHAHAVVALDRSGAGPLARRVAYALGTVFTVELAPSRFRPVDGRSHLVTLVDYVLNQP